MWKTIVGFFRGSAEAPAADFLATDAAANPAAMQALRDALLQANVQIPERDQQRILDALGRKRKLEAIKVFREASQPSPSLAAAKDFVERRDRALSRG
jgi:ribosomal protein L7/L12